MLSNISGFPEFLPNEQIVVNKVIDIIKYNFELYGFSPMDTPAVEKTSTLLAKGNDNEIYGIYRLAGEEGNNKKDLALRFDLTVPLARYVAQHYNMLHFPYRRYHIAPVWRGERPKAGRYRQFYQGDIDIIGDGELSLSHDSELLSIIYKIFNEIGVSNFIIKINNCNILTSLLGIYGIKEIDIPSAMRIIDKADKISHEQLVSELESLGITKQNVNTILTSIRQNLPNSEYLSYLRNISNDPIFQSGINDLEQVWEEALNLDVEESCIKIDPSLARGLNYYTGTVYEVVLIDYPEIGSVCGGGRYANLVGSFINKKLPGVGISIGISRMLPKLIESGLFKSDCHTPAIVMISNQNSAFSKEYAKLANIFRKAHVKTESFLQNKPLSSQMKYASRKGIRFVVIADQHEFGVGKIILRNMDTGEQLTCSVEEAIRYCTSSIL